MDGPKVPPRSAATELAGLLDSPEIGRLIAELDETRWTGRPGYPLRAMIGLALAKSLYSIPTWTKTVALVREHDALREAIGATGEPPSHWACYRFAAKLRAYSGLLDACIARVLDRLHDENPDFGRDLAIDASDLPAYANGQRYLSKNGPERKRYSDPDASWGHRSAVSTRKGGGFYGYRVHAAVCARTDLPVAWQVETAGSHESNYVAPLLDAAKDRGFAAETTALDMGYDVGRVYDECEDRDSRPIIPLRETVAVKRGAHKPPTCEHGECRFAGADPHRGVRSGGARPGIVLPLPGVSRRTACIPSSRASRSAGSRSTEAEPLSSGSSGGSRMSGRYCRSACEGSSGSSGSGSMPT